MSEESLCLDLIDRVGPGGNFLQERHTLENFRQVFYSDLFDRSMRDVWEKAGAKRFQDRLREKTLEAMAYAPEPLPGETIRELDRMQASWMK